MNPFKGRFCCRYRQEIHWQRVWPVENPTWSGCIHLSVPPAALSEAKKQRPSCGSAGYPLGGLDDTKTPPPHQFDHMLMRKLSAFKHGHVIDVDRATGSTLLKVSRLGGS